MTTERPAVRLEGLRVSTATGAPIVEDIDLELAAGEIVGIVGESGSGKTTTALALLGYATAGVRIVSGSLAIGGRVLRMDESMRRSRGSVVSYVPQDPGGALNPSLRIVAALEDVLRAHQATDRQADVVRKHFGKVGLPTAPEFARRYPHQLSGGQQQRVCIALALSCDPPVIVLDEPTTGLDVVTQAQVLGELRRLRDEHGIAMVYVTHDLAVVAQIADRIVVMYGGRIVEEGRAATILTRPRHPYTRGLIMSIPDHVRPHTLEPMPGIAVGVDERPPGCVFAPRCAHRTERCDLEMPDLVAIAEHHTVRCFHWQQTGPLAAGAPEVGSRTTETRPPLLEVERLSAVFRSRRETVVAAEDVSFVVAQRSCVALVGESGSGKTTIARAIVGLHPLAGGRILLGGQELPRTLRHRTIEESGSRPQPAPRRRPGGRPSGPGAARPARRGAQTRGGSAAGGRPSPDPDRGTLPGRAVRGRTATRRHRSRTRDRARRARLRRDHRRARRVGSGCRPEAAPRPLRRARPGDALHHARPRRRRRRGRRGARPRERPDLRAWARRGRASPARQSVHETPPRRRAEHLGGDQPRRANRALDLPAASSTTALIASGSCTRRPRKRPSTESPSRFRRPGPAVPP